jgi:predicted nucleic acid-binding protein
MEVVNIRTYTPNFGEKLLFDTNVWMFLFCPIGDHKRGKQDVYSSFFQKAIQRNCTINTNALIISEFCNAYLRIDFGNWKKEEMNDALAFKKDYVGSNRYRETVSLVNKAVKDILKVSVKNSDSFNSLQISNIQNSFQEIDFNDSYYIELAIVNNWKIVTDDGDYKKVNKLFSILTDNN